MKALSKRNRDRHVEFSCILDDYKKVISKKSTAGQNEEAEKTTKEMEKVKENFFAKNDSQGARQYRKRLAIS